MLAYFCPFLSVSSGTKRPPVLEAVSSGCLPQAVAFPFKIGNNLTIFIVATINPIGLTSNGTNFKFHPWEYYRLCILFRDPRWKMDFKIVCTAFWGRNILKPECIIKNWHRANKPYWPISMNEINSRLLPGVSRIAYQTDLFPYSHKLQQQKEEMELHPAVSSWIFPERLSLTTAAKYDDRNL